MDFSIFSTKVCEKIDSIVAFLSATWVFNVSSYRLDR